MSGIVPVVSSRAAARGAAWSEVDAEDLAEAVWQVVAAWLAARVPDPPWRAVLDALDDVRSHDEEALAAGRLAWVFSDHWPLGTAVGPHWVARAQVGAWPEIDALHAARGRTLRGKAPGSAALREADDGWSFAAVGARVIAVRARDGDVIAVGPDGEENRRAADDPGLPAELRAAAEALRASGCRCPLCAHTPAPRRRAPRAATPDRPAWLRAAQAAEAGDGDTALALLPELPDHLHHHLLRAAAGDPSTGVLGRLLAAGLAPGPEVVWHAAARGSDAGLRALLDAGGDPDAREARTQETALMAAARRGHLGTVRLLLSRGSDPSARHPPTGGTVLHWSFAEPQHQTAAHAEVWAELVRAGADPEAEDAAGRRPVRPPWTG